MRCAPKRPRCWRRSRPRARTRRCKIRCAGNIAAGKVGDTEIADYRKTEDVKPDSTTETYAALKLTIDNWRWAGVPFYLRTGKALGVKRTEVAIKFKQAPFAMFRDTPVDRLSQNYLVIGIEPTEGITLQFNTKVPGPAIDIDGVEMKFRYKDYFKAEPSTGYETLIYDCMIGDNILFQRADSVEAGWQAVQPFLDAWKKAGAKGLKIYKAGSEGPEEANDLLTRDGRSWRKLDLTMAAPRSPSHRGRRPGGDGEGCGRADAGADRCQSGRIAICLTGGSSPKQLYQLLATEAYRSRIPWDRVHWFIGDERFVPAGDPLNNMAMARQAFLDRARRPRTSIRFRPTRPGPTKRANAMSRSSRLSMVQTSSTRHARCSTWC